MQGHKWGGIPLQDAEGFVRAGEIIRGLTGQHLLVASAMFNVTNLLEQIYVAWLNGQRIILNQLLEEFDDLHKSVILGIFKGVSQRCALRRFEKISDNQAGLRYILGLAKSWDIKRAYSAIVACGELASSNILAMYMETICDPYAGVAFVDARKMLWTTAGFVDVTVVLEDSKCQSELILRDLFRKNKFVVTFGFVGSDIATGYTTTLPKNGSDLSAVLFSIFGKAKTVNIWKDTVVMTADPKLYNDAKEIYDMTHQGFVDHVANDNPIVLLEAAKMLQMSGMDAYIRSVKNPTSRGTHIH
jgi:aspartate kinase